MISNVAVQTTDAATGAASGGESADTGDTGAFDALLALQSLVDAEAVKTAANAQLAGALDGAELLAGTAEDSLEDSTDDSGDAEEALWFLSTLLPTPRAPAPAAAVNVTPGQIQNDPSLTAGVTPLTAGSADTTADLAQAFGFDAATSEGGDAPAVALAPASAATPIDTTSWNSLSGPAELFAHAARTGSTERAESAPLTTHVRDPRWADELGSRLASMVRTGESSASLQLTPADLGPLEVNISVRDAQATVHFGAANADTRALLEASIPRLREMLAAQGFQLMDSSVSHGFARQTRHESAGTPRINDLGESPTVLAQPIHITGLLDLYA